MVYRPSALVADITARPVSTFLISTSAPPITAPEASVTRPNIVANSDCASADGIDSKDKNRSKQRKLAVRCGRLVKDMECVAPLSKSARQLQKMLQQLTKI